MSALQSFARRQGAVGTIILTTLAAILINLVIYGVGTVAGGTLVFTDKGTSYHVDVLTLIGFTAIPILVGLTVVAILGRWLKWVFPLALVVAPIAAVGTIFTMTVPADLDTTSSIALAIAHVVVGIAAVLGIIALRAPAPKSAFRFA